MSDQINPFPLLAIYKEVDGEIKKTHCDERQLIAMKKDGWSMTMPELPEKKAAKGPKTVSG